MIHHNTIYAPGTSMNSVSFYTDNEGMCRFQLIENGSVVKNFDCEPGEAQRLAEAILRTLKHSNLLAGMERFGG